MSEDTYRDRNVFGGLISLNGFLGAITFASMILLIQSAEQIQHSEFLIPGTAIVSIFFIMGTLSSVPALNKKMIMTKNHEKLIVSFTCLGFFGFLIIVPFILATFSIVGAIIVGVIEVISIIIWWRTVA